MNNSAVEFINSIASNMPEAIKPLVTIKDVLEDGEALAYLGVTDEDQDLVEEAHNIVSTWIESGREFL